MRGVLFVVLMLQYLFAAEGFALFQAKAYEKAVAYYKAEKSAQAKVMLGFCYANALGVAQDYRRAFVLYKEAADEGLNIAYDLLGDLYEDGVLEGYSDHAKAMRWYEKIDPDNDKARFIWISKMAHEGFGQALFGLYVYHMPTNDYGRGFVEKNTTRALAYLKEAVEAKYPRALAEMGSLLLQSSKREHNLGVDLLMQAYALGYRWAVEELVDYFEKRSTPGRAQLVWLFARAKEGYPGVYRLLGALHSEGRGVVPDYKAAFLCYLEAAQRGDTASQQQVSELYARGKGVRRDLFKALLWRYRASQSRERASIKEGIAALLKRLAP